MAKRKTPKKISSLKPRQAKLVNELSKGKTQKQAYIDAGYTAKHPDQGAHQAIQGIKAKMADVLDRHGLTDDGLIENYLVPLLGAKITKYFAHQGKVVSSRTVEDNTTRTRALDLAFQLKGSYAPKTQEEAAVNQSFLGPTVIVLDVPRPKRPVIEVPE